MLSERFGSYAKRTTRSGGCGLVPRRLFELRSIYAQRSELNHDLHELDEPRSTAQSHDTRPRRNACASVWKAKRDVRSTRSASVRSSPPLALSRVRWGFALSPYAV